MNMNQGRYVLACVRCGEAIRTDSPKPTTPVCGSCKTQVERIRAAVAADHRLMHERRLHAWGGAKMKGRR